MNFTEFKDFLKNIIQDLENEIEICRLCAVHQQHIDYNNDFQKYLKMLLSATEAKELTENYISLFESDINKTLNFFAYRKMNPQGINKPSIKDIQKSIEHNDTALKVQIQAINFNFNFFQKISFFNSDLVIVGANGSGKTSLTNRLKEYSTGKSVVISAQRLLNISEIRETANKNKIEEDLNASRRADKTNKSTSLSSYVRDEFEIVIKYLLADNIAVGNEFRQKALLQYSSGDQIDVPPTTSLDKTFCIWNTLITHRVISCSDGINIQVKASADSKPYAVHQLSDGEKVILYLIAQVLLAPPNGFIIIDEPEMYLHKTILQRLWNILESERRIVYLYI